MTLKTELTPEQSHQLEAPVTLTPDQIAEVAGGAALTALASSIICPPITQGNFPIDIYVLNGPLATNAM